MDDASKVEIPISLGGADQVVNGFDKLVQAINRAAQTAVDKASGFERAADIVTKSTKRQQDATEAAAKASQAAAEASMSTAEWFEKSGAKIVDTAKRETQAVDDLGKAVQKTSAEIRTIDWSKVNESLASGSPARAAQGARTSRGPIGPGTLRDPSAEELDAATAAEASATKIVAAEGRKTAAYVQTGNELRTLGAIARLFGAGRVSSDIEALGTITRTTGAIQGMGTAAGEAEGAVGGLGSAGVTAGAGMVAAFAAVVLAIGAVITWTIKATDAFAANALKAEEQAQALRITTQALGQLEHAGSAVGISQEKLAQGLKSLADWMSRTGQESVPLDQMLARQADRLNAIADPAERAREAFKVFGEASQQMGLLLAKGGAGIDELRKQATNAFGPKAVADAREYRIEMSKMGEGWTNAKNGLAESFLPVMTSALQLFQKGSEAAMKFMVLTGQAMELGPEDLKKPEAPDGTPQPGDSPTGTDKATRGVGLERGRANLEDDRKTLERGRAQDEFYYKQNEIDLEEHLTRKRAAIDAEYQVDLVAAEQKAQAEENIQAKAQVREAAIAEAKAKRFAAVQKMDHEETDDRNKMADAEIKAWDDEEKEIEKIEREKLEARRRAANDERKDMEDVLRDRLDAIAEERAANEAAFGTTEEGKHKKNIELLQQELDLIDEQVVSLKAKAAAEPDHAAAGHFEDGARQAGRQRRGLQNRKATEEGKADPNSINDQFTKTITDLGNKLHTLAQGIAEVFNSLIGGAVNGIATSMEGLIYRTMTWGQALQNIGGSIVKAVINSIAQMFAEWIIKMTMIRALEAIFHTSRQTETGQALALNTANAAAASGGSFGTSAILGLVAFLALMAAVLSFSGAFARGGRPARGRTALVGEEGPELWVPDSDGTIIPADRTQSIMRMISARQASAVATGAGGSRNTGRAKRSGGEGGKIVLVDSRSEAREHLNSASGAAQIRELIRGQMIDLGLVAS